MTTTSIRKWLPCTVLIAAALCGCAPAFRSVPLPTAGTADGERWRPARVGSEMRLVKVQGAERIGRVIALGDSVVLQVNQESATDTLAFAVADIMHAEARPPKARREAVFGTMLAIAAGALIYVIILPGDAM